MHSLMTFHQEGTARQRTFEGPCFFLGVQFSQGTDRPSLLGFSWIRPLRRDWSRHPLGLLSVLSLPLYEGPHCDGTAVKRPPNLDWQKQCHLLPQKPATQEWVQALNFRVHKTPMELV